MSPPYHVAVIAETQSCRELCLEELQAGLFEACPVGGDPVAVTGGLEDIASEQTQRRGTQFRGGVVVAGVQQYRCGGRGPKGGERVDVGGVDGERVAAIAADDCPWVAQCRRSMATFDCSLAAPGAGAASCPQVLDESIRADELTMRESKTHHQF
jgi:hypothetical protein